MTEEIITVIQRWTQMSMKMSSLSLPFLTFYEYYLSGLCLFSSELRNHIRTLSNCSWQRCTACYYAGRIKKNGDICHLTLLKLRSKSQPTLNGFKWHTQMFNDVQPSDVQCFIPLKSTRVACCHIQRRGHKLSHDIDPISSEEIL